MGEIIFFLTLRSPDRVSYQCISFCSNKGLPFSPVFVVYLRQYRTNELVRRRMNFSSDAMADFEGLLEVNRKICKLQLAEKASPTLPTNCAVLP